jgi:two-component system response regulator QseB
MRILLVEDDKHLGESVKGAFAYQGYAVDWEAAGRNALSLLKTEKYDLLVLDNRLPDIEGIEMIKQIRKGGNQLPILMLTACDEVEQKINGLDAGADDYLTKPFDMNELFARVRSLLRRGGDKNPVLTAGALEMNTTTRCVRFNDTTVDDLTAKELSIIELLLRNKGRFITKERLAEGMYDLDHHIQSNTVEVYVSRLRRRFGKESIESFRGLGYRIN